MKVLVVLAVLLAVANASVLSNVAEKIMPAFAQGYIIKGEDAVPHSAPYIVSLSSKFEKHSHICGGTLINKEWVLTAAHCISKPVGMGVVAGLHKRSEMDEKTQHREVDFGKIHENYSGGVGPYDIALLHVSTPFEVTEYVQIAVLPVREEVHTGLTHLYGWGQPKSYILTAAGTLQTVETDIVNYDECKERLPENAPLEPSNICSDSRQTSISACNGDSGGPLVVEHENAPSELIGIVSWGYIPCGLAQMPSVYTRVSAYVDWVRNIQAGYAVLY